MYLICLLQKSFLTLSEEGGLMLTELRKNKDELFSEDSVSRHVKLKNAHNDGITCIELIR